LLIDEASDRAVAAACMPEMTRAYFFGADVGDSYRSRSLMT
jgi:hypothetical protein